LEHQARIIRGATPRFASQLSHKYAQLNVRAVQRDLDQNHGRQVAASYIQNVAEWVGSIAEAKEEDWDYALPPLAGGIATIAISLGGAMIPMADSAGWREAMVGTLSFDDHEGERRHTIHLAAAPEYGKQRFNARFAREIARAKQHYPEARTVGIADGAASNWAFLDQHTESQLIDFFHASETIGKLAQAHWPKRGSEQKRAAWQHTQCRRLKQDRSVIDELVADAATLSRLALADTARASLQCLDVPQQSSLPDGLSEFPRRGPADRLGRDRSRLQEPGETTPVRLRDALETPGRQDRAQPAGTDPHRRAMEPVLAEDRSIWRRVLCLITLW